MSTYDDREITRLRTLTENQDKLLNAMGFSVVSAQGLTAVYHHRSCKPCTCGGTPTIVPSIVEEGEWLVRCPECCVRTEARKRISVAIQDWNKGLYTEYSKMLREPLREKMAASPSDEGAGGQNSPKTCYLKTFSALRRI